MSRKPNLPVPSFRLSPERAEQVLAELHRVLNSAVFRSSRRCRDFLQAVTEHSVNGAVDYLKERSLGVEVFSRPPEVERSIRIR